MTDPADRHAHLLRRIKEVETGLAHARVTKDGRDGRDGMDGKHGIDGAAGPRGIPGLRGDPGIEGRAGIAGFQGRDGVNGVNGQNGRDGKDGIQGLRGERGPQGIPGPTGLDGQDGQPGAPGTDGIDGQDGEDGSTPRHEWQGSKLRLELAPGVWGKWTDLRGPRGPASAGKQAYVSLAGDIGVGSSGLIYGGNASSGSVTVVVPPAPTPTHMGRGWHVSFIGKTEADYDLLVATGAQLVRFWLSIDYAAGNSTYVVNQASLTSMRAQIAWAAARNIRFLLAIGAPSAQDYLGAIWSTPSLRSSFVEVWQALSVELLPHRHVVAELLNEPQDQGLNTNRAMQIACIEAIRAIDPARRIVVSFAPHSTPDSFVGLVPLPFDNLAYALHVYDPYIYTHQGLYGQAKPVAYEAGVATNAIQSVRAWQLANGSPEICVSEFSAIRDAPGRDLWLAECVALFNSYGWSWTYHAWRENELWDSEMSGTLSDQTRRADQPTYLALQASMAAQPSS